MLICIYNYIYIYTFIDVYILLLHSYSGRSCVSCMDGVMTYVWSMFSLLNGFSTSHVLGSLKTSKPDEIWMKDSWFGGHCEVKGLYIARYRQMTKVSFFLKKIRHLVGEEQIWKVVSFLLSAS